MTHIYTKRSPLQTISHPLFKRHQLSVSIKRDDLIHPTISGNKWRKLKHNLINAKQLGCEGVLSFGGSYSNHIHALAFACQQQDLSSIGVIRGEVEYANNATLSEAQKWGMQLTFVNRITYKLRQDDDYLQTLRLQYPNYFIVPEGGSNPIAMVGVSEIITELNQQAEFDTLMTPVGSGGTLAGLVTADKDQHNLLGIAVLKDSKPSNYLQAEVNNLLADNVKLYHNWQLLTDYHRGGYAKFSDEDCQRILAFNQSTDITFEPVYSGKMLLAFLDLVEQGYFPAHHRIVLLHTGGLQGLNGLAERGKIERSQWFTD
jgi:1-aminocyclopropane-1-carboxylate deaminase